MPASPIESERLILRRFARRDVISLDNAVKASLADLNQWLPWARTDYESSDAVAFIRDSLQAWKDDRAWDYTIRYKDDPSRHLGNISIWTVSKLGKIGEIGYWVRSDETSKGVCTEACERIIREAFNNFGFHKITLRIAIGNDASDKVAQKLGFTREGVLREELLIRGNWIDHSLWSLLDREYRSARARQQR